jgi:hypothetical protein
LEGSERVAATSNGAQAMKPAYAALRATPLSPKIIRQVRELHDRTVSLSREVSGARGRSARRDRREARQAETDLLRILGFDNYEQFSAAAAAANAPGPATRELSVVKTKPQTSAASLDAKQTEAALLRVLRREGRPREMPQETNAAGRTSGTQATSAADIDELHARISAFEEESSEARFELRRLRDQMRAMPAADDSPSAGDLGEAARDAAAGFIEAARELRSLAELLRDERREITLLAATARAEAQHMLEAARSDAQRVRDEAAADARATLDEARIEAVALTRSAISAVDGLRRLAGDHAPSADDS